MARDASDLPSDRVIVVTNPDDDCSPGAFRALLDELSQGPGPALDSIGAAAALRELRPDASAWRSSSSTSAGAEIVATRDAVGRWPG